MHIESDDDWAHAPPGKGGSAAHGGPHGLNAHLREVGRLAKEFAHEGAGELAYLAGLWHDLGKRRPGFQRYIRQAGGIEAHIEGRVRDRAAFRRRAPRAGQLVARPGVDAV